MICLMPNCCFLSETSRTLAIADELRRRGRTEKTVDVYRRAIEVHRR